MYSWVTTNGSGYVVVGLKKPVSQASASQADVVFVVWQGDAEENVPDTRHEWRLVLLAKGKTFRWRFVDTVT